MKYAQYFSVSLTVLFYRHLVDKTAPCVEQSESVNATLSTSFYDVFSMLTLTGLCPTPGRKCFKAIRSIGLKRHTVESGNY